VCEWSFFFCNWAGAYRFFCLLNEMTRSSPALFEKKKVTKSLSCASKFLCADTYIALADIML